MPRFVILRHEMPAGAARGTHWDLMLEQPAGLKTWALPTIPNPGEIVAAEELPDHRADYLNYEGEVAGGRGSVTRWDAGEYDVLTEEEGMLVVRLAGSKNHLKATLRRRQAADWELHFAAQGS